MARNAVIRPPHRTSHRSELPIRNFYYSQSMQAAAQFRRSALPLFWGGKNDLIAFPEGEK